MISKQLFIIAFILSMIHSIVFPQTSNTINWSKELETTEVDFIQYINDNNILIGIISMEDFFWKPKYVELILNDANSGKTIWKVNRKIFYPEEQTIVLTNPVILVKSMDVNNKKTKYTALDQSRGAVLWEYEAKNKNTSSILNADNNELIIITATDNNMEVDAIDINTKSNKWSVLITNYKQNKNYPAEPAIEGDNLFITSHKIACISLKDQKTLWNVQLSNDESKVYNLLAGQQSLYCLSNNDIFKLSLKSGDIIWKKNTSYKYTGIVEKGEEVFVVENDKKNKKDIISCFNSRTGNKIWIYDVRENIQSPMIFEEDKIYFTTSEKLLSIDKKLGKLLYIKSLPEAFHSDVLQLDKVYINQDQLIIGRENGLLVYDKKSGDLIHANYIEGIRPFSFSYAYNKLLGYKIGGTKKKDMELEDPEDINEIMKDIRFMNAQKLGTHMSTSLYLVNYNYNQMIQAGRMPGAGNLVTPDGMLASHYQTMYFQSVGFAIGAAVYSQLKSNTIKAHSRQYYMLMKHSMDIFDNAFTNDYFIRPFYKDGLNLCIIKISSGEKAIVHLGKPSVPYRINSVNIPIYTVSDDGITLISKTSPGGPKARKFEQKCVMPNTTGILGINGTFYYPELISLNLEKLNFDKYDPVNHKNIKHEIPEGIDKKLLDALKNKDVKQAKILIEQGADPNVKDINGINALMYSALVDDKKLQKMLLKYGADIGYTDDNNWAAWHYAFFCLAKPKSGDMLAIKYNKFYKNRKQ
ncbi:PQQ-binding-like beta-propeller repeat protein [Bacteroidota bacterium]